MKQHMVLGVVLFGSMALQLVAGHKHKEISPHWFPLAVRYEQQEDEKTKKEALLYCGEIIQLIKSFDGFQDDKELQAELVRISQLHTSVQDNQFTQNELINMRRHLKEKSERLKMVKWQWEEVFPWEEEKKKADSPLTIRHAMFELQEDVA